LSRRRPSRRRRASHRRRASRRLSSRSISPVNKWFNQFFGKK
jgi:hypothetical protein